MKRLVVGFVVIFLVAIAAGAAVLIKQDPHDFTKFLSFTDEKTSAENNGPVASDPSSAGSEKEPGIPVAAIPSPSDARTGPEAGTDPKVHPGLEPEKPEDRLAFDIARIQRDGVSVFAGQGTPGQYVDIIADGVVIGTAKVDENGEWVLVTEHNIAGDDPKLDLRIGTAPPEKQIAAKADPEVVADVRAEAASVRQAAGDDEPSPKVRELNEKMLSDLQELVDEARRADADGAAQQQAENELEKETGPAGEVATAAVAAKDLNPDPIPDTTPAVSSEPSARKAIPIPIQFVYRKATFTPDGEKAANLLLQYLQAGALSEITLSGHADERGTEALNMELSRERLKTVESYLRSGGYQGKLELLAKGKSEPFTGVDRTTFAKEELFQLDRRVELRPAK